MFLLFVHLVRAEVVHPLLEWLRSKGGFVENIAFENGSAVALDDLFENDVVLFVPREALLSDDGICELAEQLVAMYLDLPNTISVDEPQSDFFPYVKYLFESYYPSHHSPVAWSNEAKNLVDVIVGTELEPSEFGREQICETDPDLVADENLVKLLHAAVQIVWMLSDDYTMIPVLDMIPHRSGNWSNLNFGYAVHSGSKGIEFVAQRNIRKGEPIYMSIYDKESDDETTTQDLFAQYGFVEPYPRTWTMPASFSEDIVFELDQIEDRALLGEQESLRVTWLNGFPDTRELNVMNSHFQRLKKMADDVAAQVRLLDDAREAQLILEFYHAFKVAMLAAITAASDGPQLLPELQEHSCALKEVRNLTSEAAASESTLVWASAGLGTSELLIPPLCETRVEPKDFSVSSFRQDDRSCPSNLTAQERRYDPLDSRPDPLDYGLPGCFLEAMKFDDSAIVYDSPHRSHYQQIEFLHFINDETGKVDSCLYLVDFVQSCTSFRAQYHEYLVHYAAQFLNQVKRVLFLGGGDLMILHEILKYEDQLEIVVGMELDQDVVRSSFRNLGIQPQFDNPKVQWWFGDATKSLLMVPREYFGTFDLVLVDLQNYVSDFVMVTETMSIMDFAVAMLKPEGILSKNEDFAYRNRLGYAKYSVDIEIDDLPVTCHQSLTLMSKSFNFWTSEAPKDHHVETLLFEPSSEKHFTSHWGNYQKLDEDSICTSPHGETETNDLQSNKTSSIFGSSYGVLIVVEAEDVSLPLENSSLLRSNIVTALAKAGFLYASIEEEPRAGDDLDSESFSPMVFVLEQGYVIARTWPKHKYCAFDIQLWSSFEKQDALGSALVAAVGGDWNLSKSSFRIVTGGMLGILPTDEIVIESHSDNSQTTLSSHAAGLERDILGVVLPELLDLLGRIGDSVVLVMCADRQSPCESLDALSKNRETQSVVPLWTCPNILINGTADGRSQDLMLACERESRITVVDSLVSKSSKIVGIVIDPDTPRFMGQIVHKILDNSQVRRDLLSEEFVVFAPMSNGLSGEAWTTNFLERIRSEMIVFNPVFHVELGVTSSPSRVTGFEILSAGDPNFYARLIDVMTKIRKSAEIMLEVRSAKSGIINYIPDLPAVLRGKLEISNENYDLNPARNQWLSQHPLAQQSLFQFGLAPKAQLFEGENVLVCVSRNNVYWHQEWVTGRVGEISEDGKYGVVLESGETVVAVRDSIQKIDPSEDEAQSVLNFGEPIMIHDDDGEIWMHGVVVEKVSDRLYKVQRYATGTIETVERKDLLREGRADKVVSAQSLLSVNLLKGLLEDVFDEADPEQDHQLDVHFVGEGCVMICFLSDGGTVVVSWNGKDHFDVNIFFTRSISSLGELRNAILDKVSTLKLLFYDEFPRGFGRVVNHKRDLESIWFGAKELRQFD